MNENLISEQNISLIARTGLLSPVRVVENDGLPSSQEVTDTAYTDC